MFFCHCMNFREKKRKKKAYFSPQAHVELGELRRGAPASPAALEKAWCLFRKGALGRLGRAATSS